MFTIKHYTVVQTLTVKRDGDIMTIAPVNHSGIYVVEMFKDRL